MAPTGQPQNITVLLPVLNQTIVPAAVTLSGIDKVNAEAVLFVSLSKMKEAFKVKLTQEENKQTIRYYVDSTKLEDIGTGLTPLNPAFAVVDVGATTYLSGNGSVLNNNGKMLENDYLRNLALQLLGNPQLTQSFMNIQDVLTSVQNKSLVAMTAIGNIIKDIDMTTQGINPNSLLTDLSGNYYFPDDLLTATPAANICKIMWQSIESYAPQRLSEIDADGTFQELPFIEGDSFKFELIVDNAKNTGLLGTNDANAATNGNQSSTATGIIPRNYYIRYVMVDNVTSPTGLYLAQPAMQAGTAALNWFASSN